MRATTASGHHDPDTFTARSASSDPLVRGAARDELARAIDGGLTIGYGHLRLDYDSTREGEPTALSIGPYEADVEQFTHDELEYLLSRHGCDAVRRFAEVDADGRILRFTDGRIRPWIGFDAEGRVLDAEGRVLSFVDVDVEPPAPATRLVPCRFE